MPMKRPLKRDAPEPLPVRRDEKAPTCGCCGESTLLLSRRTFLRRALGTAAAATFVSLFPGALSNRPRAFAASNAGKTLVVIFQRGGNDGLNTVVPYSDAEYYTMRPRPTAVGNGIGIPPPGSGDGAGLDLPGTGFALHPAIQPLHGLYTSGDLAIVTRAGYLGSTQSHFTDQDTLERGIFTLQDGWLNRYLKAVPASGSANLRAAGIGYELAASLRGQVLVPTLNNLRNLTFASLGNAKSAMESNLRALYDQDPALTTSNPFRSLVHQLGPDMLNRIAAIEAIGPAQPQNGAVYPNTGFGTQMRDLAHVIRKGLGLEIATVDIGGWDTHEDQGGGGSFAQSQAARLADFAGAIRAFYDDLGPSVMSNVVVMTCSEFGRTVRQNASNGTDHAKATVWFLLGGGVKGGLYHGDAGWVPKLIPANLDQGRYIAPTVEFRDIYADVLTKHFGATASELAAVLPGHVHKPVGLFG
ncbi:MAG TPA: DUF1501 domain-containing protein [Nitrospira sp.]|nr:DUF1501 domain-containing protein [Nitrospira sp.]